MALKDMKPTKELNVLGQVCPYPLLMVQKETKSMKSGELLKVYCDAAASATGTIPEFCKKKGYELESVKTDKGWELYILMKG